MRVNIKNFYIEHYANLNIFYSLVKALKVFFKIERVERRRVKAPRAA